MNFLFISSDYLRKITGYWLFMPKSISLCQFPYFGWCLLVLIAATECLIAAIKEGRSIFALSSGCSPL